MKVPGEPLTGVTALITVVSETESLRQTIDSLRATSDGDIEQFLIVICDKTTSASRHVIGQLQDELGPRLTVYTQRKPFLGNAIREGFMEARGKHVVMMASDLETDPETFPVLVQEAKKAPSAVVTASRWLRPGSFDGYGQLRVFLNWMFQFLMRLLYRTRLSDLTFGYRLFPTALVQSIHWRYEKHEFLLETILKPLRLGVPVVEVPTSWRPRPEGESQNSVATQARYIRAALWTRFEKRSSFMTQEQPAERPAKAQP